MAVDMIRELFERKDHFAKFLGVEIVEIREGYAKTRVEIREHHKNPFGIAHAGLTFSLADTAFGIAVNTLGKPAVAVNINCSFLKPGKTGYMIAEAREVFSSNRLSSFDIRVSDENGDMLATFQGLAYRRKTLSFPGKQGQPGTES